MECFSKEDDPYLEIKGSELLTRTYKDLVPTEQVLQGCWVHLTGSEVIYVRYQPHLQ